ncbi:hypothetical protein [Microbacterium arborescens]|uniref:hypothetical protein n=1 Tax=Microbacterium arborescens TaxID=33883 RepID=UPI000DF76FD1|nr:hypothetical protein [Microbacterium arborescens]
MSTTLPEVTHDEISKYWHGDVDDLSPDYLDGKLGEVVDIIASRYGAQVLERLRSGKLTDRLYRATVVRVAARVWANLDGFRKENEGTYGYEINPAVGSGTIWFTDGDIEDLTGRNPKAKGAEGRIGTITVGRHRPAGRF